MANLYRQMWQHMNNIERESLLKKIFFAVVLTKHNCPDFMNKNDYEVVLKHSFVDYCIPGSENEFSIVLDCEFFVNVKNWEPFSDNFKKILNFFTKCINQLSVEDLQLFKVIHMESVFVDIQLNPPAFFQWLATHDLVTWDLVKH